MKNPLKAITLFAAIAFAPLAWAGEPYKTRVACPIGGIKTPVTQTLSCSVSNKFEMSLRRQTSCDFVTNLPVCNNYDFPIYRDFLVSEVPILKKMVKTDWYKKARKESRYLRAYLVETKLGTYSDEELYWLLQAGHFYDPQNTYGNAKYFEEFRGIVNRYLKVAKKEDRSFIFMTASFARVHTKEPEKARVTLEYANKHIPASAPYLRKYGELLEACIGYGEAKKCQPTYSVDLN